MVFTLNTLVGLAGFVTPLIIAAAADVAGGWNLVLMPIPPLLALWGWRAYCRSVLEEPSARRVSWLAFWASVAWPLSTVGSLLGGTAVLAQFHDPRTVGDAQGEMLCLVFLVIGGTGATLACGWLSWRVAHTVWPPPPLRMRQPVRTRAARPPSR